VQLLEKEEEGSGREIPQKERRERRKTTEIKGKCSIQLQTKGGKSSSAGKGGQGRRETRTPDVGERLEIKMFAIEGKNRETLRPKNEPSRVIDQVAGRKGNELWAGEQAPVFLGGETQ